MFIFHKKLRCGSTDVFDICLPKDAIEDAERRFGPALAFFLPGIPDNTYHLLGWVVLIYNEHAHAEQEEVSFFFGCKNLSETEMTTLWREFEMFVGKNLYTDGSEPEIGWFMTDTLKDYLPA